LSAFLFDMLPIFNEHGVLPEGVWDCTIDEFISRFAIFTASDVRIRLFAKLEELLADISRINYVCEIIVDGSYVTAKDEPNDIDIIISLEEKFTETEPPFWIINTLDSTRLSRKYQFDVKIVIFESETYFEYLDFFQNVRQSKVRKGVVRLMR
jgi:predicted nucleotidyltransferase